MMFWSKIFKIKNHFVVAICDKELLGKNIDSAGFKVKISKHFYGGEIIDVDKAIKLMQRSTISNIIGRNIVKIAIDRNFIHKNNIILIGGVPHAQFIQ